MEVVSQGLGQQPTITFLENEVDGGHAVPCVVLAELDLPTAAALRNMHEIEELRLASLRIDEHKGALAQGRFGWLLAAMAHEGRLVGRLPGGELTCLSRRYGLF